MSKKTEKIEMRVTKDEKEFIQERAKQFGYNSTSAYLIDSAKDFFKIDLDLTHYQELAKEINFIGKNINNLVHHIFTVGVYSDNDLKEIQENQELIKAKINKEYDHLLNLRRKYTSSNLSIKDKEKLIKELNENEIRVPKELLLEEIYERIKNNILFICKSIEDSPEQEEGISDYVYEYIYDDFLFELSDELLINFADDIYIFSEKLKMKLLNVKSYFSDDDWWDLKEILDEYE